MELWTGVIPLDPRSTPPLLNHLEFENHPPVVIFPQYVTAICCTSCLRYYAPFDIVVSSVVFCVCFQPGSIFFELVLDLAFRIPCFFTFTAVRLNVCYIFTICLRPAVVFVLHVPPSPNLTSSCT